MIGLFRLYPVSPLWSPGDQLRRKLLLVKNMSWGEGQRVEILFALGSRWCLLEVHPGDA